MGTIWTKMKAFDKKWKLWHPNERVRQENGWIWRSRWNLDAEMKILKKYENLQENDEYRKMNEN
jgi:hypothetical protein